MKLNHTDEGQWLTDDELVIPRGYSKLLDNLYDCAMAEGDTSNTEVTFEERYRHPFTREFSNWLRMNELVMSIELWYEVAESLVFANVDPWFIRKWLRKAKSILQSVEMTDLTITNSTIAEMLVHEPWFVKMNSHYPRICIDCEVVDISPVSCDILGENARLLTCAISNIPGLDDMLINLANNATFLDCSARHLRHFSSPMPYVRELSLLDFDGKLDLGCFPVLEKLRLKYGGACRLINIPPSLADLTCLSISIEGNFGFAKQLKSIKIKDAYISDSFPRELPLCKLSQLTCYRRDDCRICDLELPPAIRRVSAKSFEQRALSRIMQIVHLHIEDQTNIDYSLLPSLRKLSIGYFTSDRRLPTKLHTLKIRQCYVSTARINVADLEVFECCTTLPSVILPASVHTVFVKNWDERPINLPDHVKTFEFTNYRETDISCITPESVIVKQRIRTIQSLYAYDSVILREPDRPLLC